MSSEWIDTTLAEFAEINPKRPIPKGTMAAFVDMAALPAHSRDVILADVVQRPFASGGAKFANGDTLVARITPCLENGKTAMVSGLPVDCNSHGSTEFIVLGPRTHDDKNFLYYLARSDDFRTYAISRMEGTSGRQRVPNSAVGQYSFVCPPELVRRDIGNFLCALDDRISLLRETNATLEAIAQALFKSWFVDFDPVRAKMEGRAPEGMDEATAALFPDGLEESELGLVPRGWCVQSFRETIQIIGGGTPKTSNPEYWDGDIPWFSVVDAPATSDVFVVDTEKHITQAGLNGSSTKLLPTGTTIISARGTVGRLALTGCPMSMNQSCYGLRGLAGDSFFTYFSTKRLVDQLKQRAHGSVFDTITQESFAGVLVCFPIESVIALFEGSVESMMLRIRENLLQAQTLATLRDTLLPRLISGQLCLPEAQIAAEDALA